MSADRIACELGGHRTGAGWMACCPAHEDRVPSLSISDSPYGKVLVHCHAGCDQQAVIGALKSLGLWDGAATSSEVTTRTKPNSNRSFDQDDVDRIERALQTWRSSQLGDGTAVQIYLQSRGINITVPDALRFHAALKHPTGEIFPAMVSLVTRGRDDRPIGIHRTFLTRDGAGKAPVEPTRMMLGPCRGGAVQLAAPGKVLMIGEGIETCLSAMQATGLPAWAALSTTGLRSLDLPSVAMDVIILADGDDAGEAAARSAARRWRLEKRRVRIAHAPPGYDFNDLLLGLGPTNRKYAA